MFMRMRGRDTLTIPMFKDQQGNEYQQCSGEFCPRHGEEENCSKHLIWWNETVYSLPRITSFPPGGCERMKDKGLTDHQIKDLQTTVVQHLRTCMWEY